MNNNTKKDNPKTNPHKNIIPGFWPWYSYYGRNNDSHIYTSYNFDPSSQIKLVYDPDSKNPKNNS